MPSQPIPADDGVAWRPDEAVCSRAQLTRFLSDCGLPDFGTLLARSTADVAWFTRQVLEFLDIRFHRPYDSVLDDSGGPAFPRWCVGGGLNIVTSCLDRHLGSEVWNSPAVIWEGEEGNTRTLTYADLHREVERCAAGLRECALGKGDAIGIHLPMLPETAVALLAIGRIGAVAVPLFSGYGPSAIASRLRDVKAKALFTCDAFPRRGKSIPGKAAADEAAEACPDLARIFVVIRLGTEVVMRSGRDITWEALLARGDRAETGAPDSGVLEAKPGGPEAGAPEAGGPEDTGAEDPLLILYTSGTTGKPKGIVHSHCGFPVKSAQDMAFGTDVGPGDRIAWLTDIGWMMGPWLIYGATLRGAAMVLYDGAPDYPGPDRLWAFCARHRVGILGVSPTLVRALAAQGDELPARHDLSSLRVFASTGEPWNPEPWWWLFRTVGGSRLPIINYSGGTEISGGILMGNPLLPLKPCAFPAPCPGIAADVFDEGGQPVRGAVGELVILKPWIGMARGFWEDPERYLATYWSRWPGVWVHGDWARVDGEGHWHILGRSDDTLKVAGKRVGPAEVESVLVGNGEVVEAAVIGVPDEAKGQAMIAFCVPAKGLDGLEASLKRRVAEALGKPLQPERIFFVSALPRTRNAKVMRRVIRAAYLGEDPGDVTALENPAAVAIIRQVGAASKTPGSASETAGPAIDKKGDHKP